MPEKLTSEQFAAKVRAKYPGAYDSIPDAELTQKVVAKHPEYAESVSMAVPDNGFHMPNMEGKRLPNGYIEQGRVETPRPDSQQALETLGGMLSGPAQALTHPPQTTTEKVLQNVLPGGVALAAKRMFVDPQVNEWNKGNKGAALLPVAGPMAAAAGESINKGEYTAAGLNAIGALTAAHGAAPKVSELVRMTPKAAMEAMKVVKSPVQSVRDVLPQGSQSKLYPEISKFSPRAIRAAEDIFQASAPTNMNKGFRSNLYAATPDLAEIGRKMDLSEKSGGIINPDMRVKATVEAIRDHLKDMYETERLPQIQRNAKVPVKVSTNPNAVRGLEYIESTAGDVADSTLARKALDGGELTVAEADKLARIVNQELKSYERMTPEGKTQAKLTNPKIGGLKELDTEFTRNLNGALRANGEPGLQSYERRYAGLSAVRDQLESRMNALELHQPGIIKGVAAPVGRVLTGGRTGITSASQAAIADVNIGRKLQLGFKALAESELKPTRSIRSGAPTPTAPAKPEPMIGYTNLSRPEALKDLHSTYGVTESHVQQLVQDAGLEYRGLYDTSVSRNGLQVTVQDPQTGSSFVIAIDKVLEPEPFKTALEQKRSNFHALKKKP